MDEPKVKTWADFEVTIIERPDVLLHGIDNREFSVTLDGGAVKKDRCLPLAAPDPLKSKEEAT